MGREDRPQLRLHDVLYFVGFWVTFLVRYVIEWLCFTPCPATHSDTTQWIHTIEHNDRKLVLAIWTPSMPSFQEMESPYYISRLADRRFLQLDPRKRTIIVFHAKQDTVYNWMPLIAPLAKTYDMNIVLVEYPGYGSNEFGRLRPNEISCVFDGMAAHSWVACATNQEIYIMGDSLGCGVAAGVASMVPCAGLLLFSPFVSVLTVVSPFLAKWFFVFDVFPVASTLERVRCPVLVFHGSHDRVVSPEHTRYLERMSADIFNRTFVYVAGLHHNDMLRTTNHAAFKSHLLHFFGLPE